MVGALKQHGMADDDPGQVPIPFFEEGYCLKVQGETGSGSGFLFHNCCVTNIIVGTNFTGTVTIGTNNFTVSELLKLK